MSTHLTVGLATTAHDLAAVARLRDSVYRDRLGIDPGAWHNERARDEAGLVFMLRDNDELIGCGRAVATDSPLCELRELGQLPPGIANESNPDMCEVGRIATSRRDPSVAYGALLLCQGSRWLLENTRLRRYISYARTSLIPLYQRIGAVDTGYRFTLTARGEAEYGVVMGDLEEPAALADAFLPKSAVKSSATAGGAS